MYYHCRPLKFVEYGKVFPHPDSDDLFLPAYRWLGHYCGYCPQVWLSRADIDMTGYRQRFVGKATKRDAKDSILFGFDIIRGFPIDYGFWCGYFLNVAINMPAASPGDINKKIAAYLDQDLKDLKIADGQRFEAGEYPLEAAWERCRDLDAFLKDYVFVDRDQVVVPSLNLKPANVVICRDERQKKALRRMGFIEDRITIRSMRR